jgi:hypothetical protein
MRSTVNSNEKQFRSLHPQDRLETELAAALAMPQDASLVTIEGLPPALLTCAQLKFHIQHLHPGLHKHEAMYVHLTDLSCPKPSAALHLSRLNS